MRNTPLFFRFGKARIAISMIIGYLRLGETPESIVNEVIPHLDLAQIYDALSYYHDHKAQIDTEMAQNNDVAYWREYLQNELGDEGLRKLRELLRLKTLHLQG